MPILQTFNLGLIHLSQWSSTIVSRSWA